MFISFSSNLTSDIDGSIGVPDNKKSKNDTLVCILCHGFDKPLVSVTVEVPAIMT